MDKLAKKDALKREVEGLNTLNSQLWNITKTCGTDKTTLMFEIGKIAGLLRSQIQRVERCLEDQENT